MGHGIQVELLSSIDLISLVLMGNKDVFQSLCRCHSELPRVKVNNALLHLSFMPFC